MDNQEKKAQEQWLEMMENLQNQPDMNEMLKQQMAMAQQMMNNPEMQSMMQQQMEMAQHMANNMDLDALMQQSTAQAQEMFQNQDAMGMLSSLGIDASLINENDDYPDVLTLEELKKSFIELNQAVDSDDAIRVEAGHEYHQSFEVLLSGVLSCMNAYPINSLEVTQESYEKAIIGEMLEESWNVQNREEVWQRLVELTEGSHTQEYTTYYHCHMKQEMPVLEDAEQQNRFAFTQVFADQFEPSTMLGWDLGRAAMMVRWGYTMAWITEQESWEWLAKIEHLATTHFKSWKEFGFSYLFGSLYWMSAFDLEEELTTRYYMGSSVLNELLNINEEGEQGIWQAYPWIEA